MTASEEQGRGRSQWLLPIDPSSHAEHLPDDWRTRHDATQVWEAIGRSQSIGRWCLRSGYRTMRAGDVVWAYLSKRQEVCARGAVRAVVGVTADGRENVVTQKLAPVASPDVKAWFVDIDWDDDATAALRRNPLSRRAFGQIPMSTCRADDRTISALQDHLRG